MRTLGPRMNADERNLLAELNAAVDDDGEDGGPATTTAATWGCCPALRRPGELLTRGDVCHVHADPRSTASRGRCRAPRAAGYAAAPRSRQTRPSRTLEPSP